VTKREARIRNEMLIGTLILNSILFALVGCAKDGGQGEAGANGESCVVIQAENGAEFNCAGETTAVVLNGQDADDMYIIVNVHPGCGGDVLETSTGELIFKTNKKGKGHLVKGGHCE
jgi:hypothetical protein